MDKAQLLDLLRAVQRGETAPEAAAANAMGPTSVLRPVAWLGSTMTGRCVSSRSTGTAERSSVLRV